MLSTRWLIVGLLLLVCVSTFVRADDDSATADSDPVKTKRGSATDDEVLQREEEAIKLDGLSVAQMKELRSKAEKFQFQAEVSRMMKLIINSLYRNKEVSRGTF